MPEESFDSAQDKFNEPESIVWADFRTALHLLCQQFEERGLTQQRIILTLHNQEYILLAKEKEGK